MSAALSIAQRSAVGDLSDRASIAASVWDSIIQRRMQDGHRARFGAIVENIVAAIQASVEPSEWARAGDATAETIERRVIDGSALAAVLVRLRPGIAITDFNRDYLGTDSVGRGAGWHKTANTVEVAKACNDAMVEGDIMGGALFRALKDIVVTALSGLPAVGRGDAAREVGALIRRRMAVS